jgi:hypothetical protein
MTPLSFPLLYNTMHITGGKSSSETVQWKYKRLPGFGDTERYDVVVFNYPAGDTVALEERNGQFIINGQAINTYTFKMNYYWMMGDKSTTHSTLVTGALCRKIM